ncbi:metallophosphoesterase family protein [Desulfosediminicola flagellatus]|uniref:metallophosphoesterase family protein n=1 Tax=Desulfosediminicola flagellatus TaxID=2569541 RepID=UPI0010AD5EBC|nr:metallophosphoesterase family protein [Desulfosediminicola flagellatus]
MKILLLADIHGNFPALEAIEHTFKGTHFDYIINCGDSVVYAPFPNEVIHWLMDKKALSILGNTDKKVIKLLKGKTFKKPSKPDKRIMYSHTADILDKDCSHYLMNLPISREVPLFTTTAPPAGKSDLLGVFHGSPAAPHEFLFDISPENRFKELASEFPYRIVVTGHSHTPYHFQALSSHFINPGSAGRMFDGDPRVSCAVLSFNRNTINVTHYRIEYNVNAVIEALNHHHLPPIYQMMYSLGKKLN